MRRRFTRALYAVSAAAVLAGSLGITTTTAANAAPQSNKGTVACGSACLNIFSAQIGSNVTMNAFIAGDTGTGGRVGQKVNMRLSGNFRPNGDWQPAFAGAVASFCGSLLDPQGYICLHYSSFPALELAWAPFGNQSDLCAGVARGNVSGENITLQTCGVSARTLWVLDQNHHTRPGSCLTPANPFLPVGPGRNPNVQYCPWINGADHHFTEPLVMTLNTGTQHPRNQLILRPLNLVGGQVRTNELFAFFIGPV